MVKIGSFVYCVDRTGVLTVKIIQVLGNSPKRYATLGSKVIVVVKTYKKVSKFLSEKRNKTRFKRGSIHRAVLIHQKQKFRRKDFSHIWYDKNAIILVDKKFVPFSKRINVTVPREVANKFPVIGSVSKVII